MGLRHEGPLLTGSDPDRHLRTDHLTADLGRRALRGGGLAFAAQAVKVLAQFAALVVLARLLPPRAFGLIAMVAALNTIFDLVKELGLSAATIQKTGISHEQVTALFWINVIAGTAITAILFLVAPLIAQFYAEPELIWITRLLALGFLVNGLAVQHWALLRRQMRFAASVALDTGADVASLVVAASLAFGGAGYGALVAQRLIGPCIVLIGSWWLCQWRPSSPRHVAGMKGLLGFGAAFTISNASVAFSRTIDQVLVGWLWGPNILGLYERAAKLALVPVNNINVPLYSVAMPTLSRIVDEPQRYRRAFCHLMEKLAMVLVPGALLVAVSASLVVQTLFGPQWTASTPFVACFAVAASVQPLALATLLLPQTQNRPRDMMWAAFIDAILCLISVIAGLPFGAIGIAGSYALFAVFARTPIAFWVVSRRGPVGFWDLGRSIYPSMLAGVAVAGCVWPARIELERRGINAHTGLVIVAVLGVAVALVTFAIVPRSRRSLRMFRLVPAAGEIVEKPEGAT
jgi:polysaccharide transporter, PST family